MGDSLVLGHVHYFLHVKVLLYFTLNGNTDRWEMGTSEKKVLISSVL